MAGIKNRRAWVLSMTAAAAAWLAWQWWDAHGRRRAVAEIEAAMRGGQFDRAVEQLTLLSKNRPRFDEAAYLLGVCEKVRGHNEAAIHAWERVSSRSPFGGRAILGRMDLLVQTPVSPTPRT